MLATLLILSLAACGTTGNSGSGSTGNTSLGYVNTIFDTSYVHEINVEISAEDWDDLLQNPTDKTKYSTTITIDGTTLQEVSFATKGNTSLSQVAATDSDRYSFKLNFGKFVDGQTYEGLDKLNLNNIYSDATYLKDYLSYRIMAETGVAAPLVSFVALSINGEYYGLYVAIEEVGDSFLARNYGEQAGNLYKPETSQFENMGGGGMGGERPDFGDGEMPDGFPDMEGDGNFTPPEDGNFTPPADGNFTPPDGEGGEMPGGGGGMGGGMGQNANGADLVYTDDEIASYSDIFDNAETKADEEDYQRVIAALQTLASGQNLNTAVDIEAQMRYFAAHNFVVNFDSYTGNMLHNYYLYEQDGQLTMLPWDYNLAFGGFNGTSASAAVNWPINSPLGTNVAEDSRPMWAQLAANDEYLALYHSYLDSMLSGYFESGRFEEEIDTLYALIRPYVETDPTAFYTVEEFDTAVATLKSFCLLRAESVRGQLNGTIPATAAAQQADASSLVDTGTLNMSDMGSMGGGDRADGMGGRGADQDGSQDGSAGGAPPDAQAAA